MRVVDSGPAIGHTLQKFDGRPIPRQLGRLSAQRVGVAVRDRALLASIGIP